MRYPYNCKCGCVIQMELDSKPPKTVKCYKCGEMVSGSFAEEIAIDVSPTEESVA